MDEFAPAPGAALSRPRPVSCPPWCTESPHGDLDPPGTVLHRSPPATVAVYEEACALVAAHVWAVFWDKAPEWIGTDPADLERTHVEVAVPEGAELPLSHAGTARRALDRCARQCAVTAGLMPRRRSAWMGHGCPTVGHRP